MRRVISIGFAALLTFAAFSLGPFNVLSMLSLLMALLILVMEFGNG